jgi:hypothetical protein
LSGVASLCWSGDGFFLDIATRTNALGAHSNTSSANTRCAHNACPLLLLLLLLLLLRAITLRRCSAPTAV